MKTLETIAVGFDDSPDSRAAVRWAMSLASHVDADVVIVHAVGLMDRFEGRDSAPDIEESLQRLCEDCDFDRARVRVQVSNGDACSVLLRAADDPISADLLIVGSRGQGKHPGLLLGSTSLELAEHATVPVVIVPSL
ncbi:MAG: universal stress protein [Acidimicrobiales bacterium]